jgi:hypothetical protein
VGVERSVRSVTPEWRHPLHHRLQGITTKDLTAALRVLEGLEGVGTQSGIATHHRSDYELRPLGGVTFEADAEHCTPDRRAIAVGSEIDF